MRVTINGREMSFSGSGSICVSGNSNVVINGKAVNGEFLEGKTIDIHVEGNVENLETTGSVTVSGNVGRTSCGGSATIGHDVVGNINAGGSVHVNGKVQGGINAGGSVYCGESESPQSHNRQYYEGVIKDIYESEKGLETVEEGVCFMDTLRTLFGVKLGNKKTE